MKTNHLLFLIALVLFTSCQQEETIFDSQQNELAENWKKAAPQKMFDKAENGFSISKQALEQALSLPNVTIIRFVLEVDNNKLQVRVLGADNDGNTSKGILAKPISLEKTINKLFVEKSVHFEKAAFSKTVASHIMQPEEAVIYISKWQEQVKNEKLHEVVAYDEVRIEHFSMPATVGEQMLQSSSKNINLVWGVNPQGKFTTVFLPELDRDNKLLKSNEPIFEYLRPCPPTCPITGN